MAYGIAWFDGVEVDVNENGLYISQEGEGDHGPHTNLVIIPHRMIEEFILMCQNAERDFYNQYAQREAVKDA